MGRRTGSNRTSSNLRSPAAQHVLDTLPHLISRRLPAQPRHQQLVVVGVDVADRRNDGEVHGVGIQSASGRAASDPTAAA
jgi:hypothetical protein